MATVTRYFLPRSQTSLSLRKGWARKGWREGERMRDVWQILFSRWRNVQWRMIAQFSKRSIDLFVLRILKGKWFSSSSVPGGSCFPTIERATASLQDSPMISMPFRSYRVSMPKNYRRNRLWFARTKDSCTAMMFAMYLLHAGGLLEYCLQLVCEISTEIDCTGKQPYICNTGAMLDHVLKRR